MGPLRWWLVPVALVLACARPAAPPAVIAELVLLDANPRTMYDVGRLPGARWIKFDEVSEDVLPADRATPLVFYCANARCTASPTAARAAVALGYVDVSLMPAGYFGWKAAGKPIERP